MRQSQEGRRAFSPALPQRGTNMRKITPEALRAERLALSKLEQDWNRMNRPHVDKGLRDSLYTRILELRANVSRMEAQAARAERAERKAA